MENAKEEEQQKNEANKLDEEIYGESPFSFEQLKAVWADFAQKTKSEGRDSEYAVLKQDIRLENETTIIITFTNSVKLMILDKFKSDLITYLKRKLDNRFIKLETDLKEEESAKIPYTNREKFEYLIEKKPILKELQNRLGLDPDY